MKINPIFYVVLICSTFFSCHDSGDISNTKAIYSFGSSENKKDSNKIYDKKSYQEETNAIIEKGEKRIKVFLANAILEQVNLIKPTLTRVQEQAIITYTFKETEVNIQKVKQELFYKLFENELKVNQIYFEIADELTALTNEYKKHHTKLKFEDYTNIRPFILSDEVFKKVKELVHDEDERIAKEQREIIQDLSITAIGMGISSYTGGLLNEKIFYSVVKAARLVRKGLKLANDAGRVTSMTYKILSKTPKLAPIVTKVLANNKNRIIHSNKLKSTISSKISEQVVSGISLGFAAKKTEDYFKSIDNKIEGRIGDYSDGIISLPMQELIDINKRNATLLTNR